MALDEILIFGMIPELFLCTIFVCSFIHLSIEHILVELHCIINEKILFNSRKLHEGIVGIRFLVEIICYTSFIAFELLLLSLTQELDILSEFLLELLVLMVWLLFH